MGINLEALAKKLESGSTNNSGGTGSLFWGPKGQEKSVVRIVPYIHDLENPFREFRFHYNLLIDSKKPVVSPSTYGDPDPIYEFAKKLSNSSNKEDIERGKDFFPRLRYFVPILVRGLEHEGVKFWGISKTTFTDIGNTMLYGGVGDISDLQSGNDIIVTYREVQGRRGGETRVIVVPEKTPATNDATVLAMIKEVPDLKILFPAPSYDELVDYLKAKLKNDQTKVVAKSFEYTGPTGGTISGVTTKAPDLDSLMASMKSPATEVAPAVQAQETPAVQIPSEPAQKPESGNALSSFEALMSQLTSK